MITPLIVCILTGGITFMMANAFSAVFGFQLYLFWVPTFIIYTFFCVSLYQGFLMVLIFGVFMDLWHLDHFHWAYVFAYTFIGIHLVSHTFGKLDATWMWLWILIAAGLTHLLNAFFNGFGHTPFGFMLLGMGVDCMLGLVFFKYIYPLLVRLGIHEPMSTTIERLQDRRYW